LKKLANWTLTTEDWINYAKSNVFSDSVYNFPSDKIKEEYIVEISQRTDKEVIDMIRLFLVKSVRYADSRIISVCANIGDIILNPSSEFDRRLVPSVLNKNRPHWEWITWIIDLVENSPEEAIAILKSYLHIHNRFLTQAMYLWLLDAIALIRAKFIDIEDYHEAIFHSLLTDVEFENLVCSLYQKMGYETFLTKRSGDWWIDVVAEKNEAGEAIRVWVECKCWNKDVGEPIVRNLLWAILHKKCAKWVLISAKGFTKPAKIFAKSNNQIELLDGKKLYTLLNKNLGKKWMLNENITKWVNSEQIKEKRHNALF